MKKIALVVAVVIASMGMAGCAGQHYINANPGRNNQASLSQDSSYCQAVAVGSISMPSAPQYQNNVPMYAPGSGTMRDQYGNTYRYQEIYNPMNAKPFNGFRNLPIKALLMRSLCWEGRMREVTVA